MAFFGSWLENYRVIKSMPVAIIISIFVFISLVMSFKELGLIIELYLFESSKFGWRVFCKCLAKLLTVWMLFLAQLLYASRIGTYFGLLLVIHFFLIFLGKSYRLKIY